jgi:hypothetical protein
MHDPELNDFAQFCARDRALCQAVIGVSSGVTSL